MSTLKFPLQLIITPDDDRAKTSDYSATSISISNPDELALVMSVNPEYCRYIAFSYLTHEVLIWNPEDKTFIPPKAVSVLEWTEYV